MLYHEIRCDVLNREALDFLICTIIPRVLHGEIQLSKETISHFGQYRPSRRRPLTGNDGS